MSAREDCIQPRKNIRWSRLIDELLDAGAGYDRMTSKTGMPRCVLDELSDGRIPTNHEKEQLRFIASHYVSIERLLYCGFTYSDIDDMCLLTDCSATKIGIIAEPVRVFT